MEARETLQRAGDILRSAKLVKPKDIRDFLRLSAYIVKSEWTAGQRAGTTWLTDWAESMRRLYDQAETTIAADPMILYEPKNATSEAFHRSLAFIRYFRAGNRTSKSQSGYAEHYHVATGQHKWQAFPPPPHDMFIIGVNFAQYAHAVFERKFITGEQNNTLSPMFPIGGKWLYKYDEKKHTLYLACPPCAAEGKAGSCKHRKSTIKLYSDEGGWEVLQGATFILGHFDEHIKEDFFQEAMQRVAATGGKGRLIVTGTPLHGFEAWEHRRLTSIAEGDPKQNRVNPRDKDSAPFVSIHQIDQFKAGIVPHDQIRLAMRTMDDFEIESRVYGRPAPLAKNPVFDRKKLSEMRKLCTEPKRIVVQARDTLSLTEVSGRNDIEVNEFADAPIRLWEKPDPHATYIASVDTAAGLAGRDASCCSIIKVSRVGLRMKLQLVAQYHGWQNPLDYADEVFKLAVWYNDALAVVELTGGLGRAVVLRLKQDIGYWNIFRDIADPESAIAGQDPRFGVDTNVATKPMMVAALQQCIRDGMFIIPCRETIAELVAFEQERTETGLNTRYRGAGGSADDRTMSLVIGAAVAISYPVLDMSEDVANSMPSGYNEDWQKIHKEIAERNTYDPLD